jgi:hypothetical protein
MSSEDFDKEIPNNDPELEIVYNQDDMNSEKFKRVIKEIIRDIKGNAESGIPLDMFVEQLKVKYKITDYPELDIEKSLWVQCTKNIQNFQPSLQGHRLATKPEGKIRIPIYAYTVDVEHGDVFIKRIVENYNKIQKK